MTAPSVLRIEDGNEKAIVQEAARVLENGALAIIPTETVYGVAAHALISGAEAKIFQAKRRSRSKPLPLLAASVAAVEKFGGVLGAVERRLAEKFWPGPLTLVLRTRRPEQQDLPALEAATEGFRVPDCEITRWLLELAGGVLRVTSANRSGEPPALTADDAVRALGEFVDIVVDAGPARGGTPSTVVAVKNGSIVMLREGEISQEELNIQAEAHAHG